ncbi:glycosyltransferase [Wocania ichthyoenteri]|uniref:glycosyltransferase n=1 Tax=Wocania ichthyoenteri TaxID=1230531 RepID=UPI00053DE460|nr:glycosyltransferase [Wocania ichthyoenteri]
MKLSILIPMYNAEAYIERCLNSLIMQNIDKKEYEIVIINDGSTDKSLEKVINFSKKHNNVFVHSYKNQGVIATRNKLLKLAKGDYIYFVDADDYVSHNSLDVILNAALKNKLDIMGFGALVTFDNLVSDSKYASFDCGSIKITDGAQFLKEDINLRVEIWWYLVRKEFIDDLKLSFKDKGYDDDLGFTLALFISAKRVGYCKSNIYRYFQSSESTMRSSDLKHKKRIANYFLALITDFTNIINELDTKSIKHKEVIKNNFKYRRDTFTFFTIIKMIKAQFTLNVFKNKINSLQAIGAYPITDFAKENKDFKFKILANIFNNKKVLFATISLYKFLVKN